MYAERIAGLKSSAIRDILKLMSKPGIISGAGGMFIWAILPEGYDAREILMRCIEKDVAFVPGQEFFPDGSGKNTMRLNFSNATAENIEEGIRRIGEVLIKISP